MIYFCISTIESEQAADFARLLIENHMAACVNVLPASSHYRWDGKINCTQECVLLIKSSPKNLQEFKQSFVKIHPYDCPELLMFPAEEGLEPYFDWVRQSCQQSPGKTCRKHRT